MLQEPYFQDAEQPSPNHLTIRYQGLVIHITCQAESDGGDDQDD